MSKTKKRCLWVNLNNPLYVEYHDKEWGVPDNREQYLFEMLVLEGMQAGLSWELILNKRANYRKLFANFDIKKVAKFTDAKLEKILTNPGIIRNKLKVKSIVTNANAFIKVQEEFGSFYNYIWSYVDFTPIVIRKKDYKSYPTNTKLSGKISKDLKKRGFKFVGSTIIYSYMQAIGMTNDHTTDCFLSNKQYKVKKPVTKNQSDWYLYIIRCKDNSLYTGITTDVKRRFNEHSLADKKSAKYLRGKTPLKLETSHKIGSKSEAAKLEAKIKKLTKAKKEHLLKAGITSII